MARPKRLVHCLECNRNLPHKAHGLCDTCYNREHVSRWKKANPAKKRAHNRRWAKANPGKQREYNRRWAKANPGKQREYNRRWFKANPAKKREYMRRRRAAKRGATVEPVDEAAIYERCGYTCVYCGATEDLTLDHVIPLAGGGAHSEDNLVVACRRCNSSKQATPLAEWQKTESNP